MHVEEYFVSRECSGARPYRVLVRSDGWVRVFRPSPAGPDAYEIEPCFASATVRVFRGDNVPGGGWAETDLDLDGNTFLLCVGVPADNGGETWRYVHIDQSVREFASPFEIVRYVSPVCLSGYAYSYAIDEDDRVYLLSFMDVVYASTPAQRAYIDEHNDAYNAYYPSRRITASDFFPASIPGFCPAVCLLAGEAHSLRYWSDAADKYDTLEAEYGAEPMYGSEFMALVYADGSLQPLDKNGYVSLIESFGAAAGISPLGATVLAR